MFNALGLIEIVWSFYQKQENKTDPLLKLKNRLWYTRIPNVTNQY